MKKLNTDIIKKAEMKHIFCKNWNDKQIEELAKEMLTWFESDKDNLWLNDFAIEKRINRQRISDFARRSEFFGNVYEHCRSIQESRAVKLALSNKSNPAFIIFFLKNHFKWSEQPKELAEDVKITVRLPFNM